MHYSSYRNRNGLTQMVPEYINKNGVTSENTTIYQHYDRFPEYYGCGRGYESYVLTNIREFCVPLHDFCHRREDRYSKNFDFYIKKEPQLNKLTAGLMKKIGL